MIGMRRMCLFKRKKTIAKVSVVEEDGKKKILIEKGMEL